MGPESPKVSLVQEQGQGPEIGAKGGGDAQPETSRARGALESQLD